MVRIVIFIVILLIAIIVMILVITREVSGISSRRSRAGCIKGQCFQLKPVYAWTCVERTLWVSLFWVYEHDVQIMKQLSVAR